MHRPWEGYVKPFRIFGNLYFVGTVPASTHVIDTGDGLIVIDPGLPNSLYLVLENMRALGLNPYDIKYIINTHGHFDHCGASKALAELTGAKNIINKADEPLANGTVDLTWASDLGFTYYEYFNPDILVDDGDTVSLGNTTVLFKAAPGHTAGTMAIFFDVTDGKSTFRAAMHGGVGRNSMRKEFLDKVGLSADIREKFVPAIEKMLNEKVDIMLGNHVRQNDTLGKAEQMTENNNPFINPNEWKKFLLENIEKYNQMIKEEAKNRL